MREIISIKNLNFSYGNNSIFEASNLSINEGDFAVILGENGTGKSTLIKLILGELKASSGTIDFNISHDLTNISYVPQLSAASMQSFPITAYEIVSLNLYSELKGLKIISKEQKKRIDEALRLTGMISKKDYLYSNLSGGERQRIMLAKAIVSNPKILLLDEPTVGIDELAREKILKILNHFNKDHNVTIIMITHEVSEVLPYVNALYEVKDKKIRKRSKDEYI
ncbi:MAG: ATP-binding cassette domain-containing protein [Tissierellia bacterium]|nr:ATP-binding cassette domain-containing protein [Tissierellia bacterium]